MNFLKKNLSTLVILFSCILLVLINFDFTKLVIGLDNASPYFNIFDVLARIKGTSSVVYGGILFQTPFIYPLRSFGFTPEAVSNLYLSLNFLLGALGIALLVKQITKDNVASIFSSLVLITSLFTIWIFSSPNFLFIAAYGTIPLLIYFLSKNTTQKRDYLAIAILSIMFLTTTLNIVAFAMYLLQIILITLLISRNKYPIRKILLWTISLIITWLISIQVMMIVNGDYTLFITQIFNYIRELLHNPYMSEITKDILASEERNSLLDVARFSTGWMELHDSNNMPIFAYYDLYKSNLLFILIGIFPFLISLSAIYFEKSRRVLGLTFILLFFLIITSTRGVAIIEQVPLIKDALRWPTSKLWPIYILPLTLLGGIFVSNITKRRNILSYFILIILFVSLSFYAFPILNSNLISKKTEVNIPEQYFTIPENSKIFVLPAPQKLYMREYEWGYYGSDFLSYINNSEFLDGANLYEYAKEYQEILENENLPEDIEFILYDISAEINSSEESLRQAKRILEKYKEITSNRYFKLYEKQ